MSNIKPHEERDFSFTDWRPNEAVIKRGITGADEPYSENYGRIDFYFEDGEDGGTKYLINFNDETKIEFVFRSNQGMENILRTLEALTRNIRLDDAVEEIYDSGMSDSYNFDPILNQNCTLEEKYMENLSDLLEEEFWRDKNERESSSGKRAKIR